MSRRLAPCGDCQRLIRPRSLRCFACEVARRREDAKRGRAACRVCGIPLDGGRFACSGCADAYWRGERARVRQAQLREGRCYACDRWHERETPGSLFCAPCSLALTRLQVDYDQYWAEMGGKRFVRRVAKRRQERALLGVAALYTPTGDRLAA